MWVINRSNYDSFGSRKQQSCCAKEIWDGEPTHKVEDVSDFLRKCNKVMEGPVLPESLDPVVNPRYSEPFNPFGSGYDS